MNSTDALQASLKNAREVFLNMLDSIVILDIGVINEIKENGRAYITSSTFIKGHPVVYEDAEIIYPGNVNGSYATACAGTACLIFIPKSCMPDTSNLKLYIGSTSYNRSGVKAMPIGNGNNNTVQTAFGIGGMYSITGQTYTIQFTEEDVTFQRSDGRTTLSIDCEGQVYLSYTTNNGTYLVNIEDGHITSSWLSKEKDRKWVDTLNSDGSRSFTQINPQQQSDNVLFSFSVDADGAVTFTMAQDLTLETKGTLALKGANVTINSTADNSTVNINSGNAVVDK